MGIYRWTKDARCASRRKVDDSLSGNFLLRTAFRGYRFAQPTAKSGFFPAGKYCRGAMRGCLPGKGKMTLAGSAEGAPVESEAPTITQP